MMEYPTTHISPPGGWRYEHPQTGIVYTAINYSSLIGLLRKKLIPCPSDVEALVQDQTCKRIYNTRPDLCKVRGMVNKVSQHDYTFSDVVSFLSAMKFLILDGTVDQEEANQRAAICVNCPLNSAVSGCVPCSGIGSAIQTLIGNKNTPADHLLKTCGVCGCVNKVKVWVKRDTLAKLPSVISNQEKYPDGCWQKLN
jgi:hypothetical protein